MALHCSENTLKELQVLILQCAFSVVLNEDQKPLILAIKKLKCYMTSQSEQLITWSYNTLLLRKAYKAMTDPINEALVSLIKDCIAFTESIRSSCLDAFFALFKESDDMTWLLCLIAEKLPQILIPRIHQYLTFSLSCHGNPFLSSPSGVENDYLQNLISLYDRLFKHLLQTNAKPLMIKSVCQLFHIYFEAITSTSDSQKFILGYILSLPKISPTLTDESWADIFKTLYENDAAGNIFLHEKNTNYSLVKLMDGNTVDLVSLFPSWLARIAFNPTGVVISHAIDVAIILDTLTHDPRLELKYLLPTGDQSIIDKLRPSFDTLDLKPTSINLVDWALSILGSTTIIRKSDDLSIPLFLSQLTILKSDSKEDAVNLFSQLISRLDLRSNYLADDTDIGAKYLILNLLSSAESKWPGIFQHVLQVIFSQAIAMHIADSEGSVNVEKILGNLAMLFEESNQVQCVTIPGFDAFQKYFTNHWRQVLLLFLNHPSLECRAMGYRLLANSHFWEHSSGKTGDCDPQVISNVLINAWFRHMKNRYMRYGEKEELLVVNEQQRLITHCCRDLGLAKTMLYATLDFILNGALEIFPSVDINSLQRERMRLIDKVRQKPVDYQPVRSSPSHLKPPQFIISVDFVKDELDIRDKIYVDNIERTASLFSDFHELPGVTSDACQDINFSLMNRLISKWSPQNVPLDTYDDVLPKNIPHGCDIMIGSAFKDHPILFLILEKCMDSTRGDLPVKDIIRSILVYFIVFWNMKEVVNVPTTLKFATQLEETIRLHILLKKMLPEFLHDIYQLFPFLSAKEMGYTLFNIVWYYLRWHPNTETVIPGIEAKFNFDTSKEEQQLRSEFCLAYCSKRDDGTLEHHH
ncbi:hypothetical protein BDB01DRAFT_800369 [Pilobolus umbonatus]|nr:hypothetical protein BDB01DRAFT_800369 [Pilobolus umbonatus]